MPPPSAECGPGRGNYAPGCGSMRSGAGGFVVMPCKVMLFIVLMFPLRVKGRFHPAKPEFSPILLYCRLHALGGAVVSIDKLPVPICRAGVYNAAIRPEPIA